MLAGKTVLVYFIVVGIIHESNFLVFPVDPVNKDIMPDVQVPVSLERLSKGLADLLVFCKSNQFLPDLAEPHGVLLPHFPERGLDFGIRNYREAHCLIFRMKSSIEGYVFPFPFEIPFSDSLIFCTNAGLMADSGG